MPNHFYISILALLFTAQVVHTQPALEEVQHLSYKDGLSDRVVNDITQDSKGFMWIATQNGLNRYTGLEFNTYTDGAPFPNKIGENQINKVVEIADQQLILLNDRKVVSFEVFDLESSTGQIIDGSEIEEIRGRPCVIYIHPLDNVYLLVDETEGYSIYQFNKALLFEKIGDLKLEDQKPSGELRLIKSQNGYFWIQDSQNGLVKYSPTTGEQEHISIEDIHALTFPSVNSYSTSVLHEDKNGQLWTSFPFRTGLLKAPPYSSNIDLAKNFPTDELYSGIWGDKKGNLMIATFQSFGKTKQLFQVNPSLEITDAQWVLDIDEKINTIYGDDFSNFFTIGTYVGIYKIAMQERPIEWVLADRQLEDNEWSDGISIRSITDDKKGNIYISRELKAWYKMNMQSTDREIKEIAVKDANGQSVRLWCNSNVVYDPAGYLWGGSCADDRGGLLHKYDLKTGIAVTYPIENKVIRHIVQMQNGDLLLATGAEDGDGLISFFNPNSEQFTHFKNIEGSNPMAGVSPSYAHIDRDGLIWVGTGEGLIKIDTDNQSSTIYTKKNSQLTNDNILVIHEAEDGKLWLGTHSGINIFDKETEAVRQLNDKDGLCNNIVCGILPDDQGNYLISTFYGLSYYDTKNELFSNFYQSKGLTFNEFNRLAAHQDNNGNYYFGSLNGVNIFKKEDLLSVKDSLPDLQWTNIAQHKENGGVEKLEANFTSINSLILNQGDDYLEVGFCLPYYASALPNQYAVKLEGLDTKWKVLGEISSYELNRPPPGEYKLRVKAAPAKGVWMEKELQLDIEVKQAFYQKPWFQVALPLMIILLSYLAAQWYVNRIKLQEEKQTRINKQFAELELQALQSQMNPHFVFNSLGSIQYFIQKNNTEAADNFLAKFAKLMRMFLESSKNKYISLAEEIKLLDLYLQMEKMRFEDKFEYKISVDSDIDVHFRELPSVLIQPFIENSINHGIFNKDGKGHININFTEDEEGTLTCEIKDDGVGRKKAAELKGKTRKAHKSRGMQIVSERLDVLQQMDDLNIKIKIHDLYPDKENTGTIVRIEIPDIE